MHIINIYIFYCILCEYWMYIVLVFWFFAVKHSSSYLLHHHPNIRVYSFKKINMFIVLIVSHRHHETSSVERVFEVCNITSTTCTTLPICYFFYYDSSSVFFIIIIHKNDKRQLLVIIENRKSPSNHLRTKAITKENTFFNCHICVCRLKYMCI